MAKHFMQANGRNCDEGNLRSKLKIFTINEIMASNHSNSINNNLLHYSFNLTFSL